MAGIPKWLRDQILTEDALRFAPRPSVNDVVARMNLPRPQSTEDFLRMLRNEAQLGERLAVRATDDAMTQGENIFGLPVKTIEQGRSLGERNLPGIDSLSPEDQIALAQALDKGAMLRSMTGTSPAPELRRTRHGLRLQPANRADAFTGAGSPFGMVDDLSMGNALALLQNKRDLQGLVGRSIGDLPNPPALRATVGRGLAPSGTAEALGDDVADLVGAIRRDRIDSMVMQLDEMRRAELQADMARSADEVAAMEARAMEYGGLPPETLAQMDRSNRSYKSLMSGQTERLTGDPRSNWARQAGGNMDPVVGSPLYPPSQRHLVREGETASDHFWRTQGKDLVKGFTLGHLATYPAMYAAYRMMQPSDPVSAPSEPARQLGDVAQGEDEAFLLAERNKAIAESQKAYDAEQTRAFLDALPDVPIAWDGEPTMPKDEVGVADDAIALAESGNAADLAAEQSPPPTIADLDEELRKLGLQGVPSWYIRAMKDPSVKMIDGMPKEEFMPFSSKSKEYPIQQRYVLEGMTR